MKTPPRWISCGSFLFFCAAFGLIVWKSFQPSSADLADVRKSLSRKGYTEIEITGMALCGADGGADGVSFRAKRNGVLIESKACAHDETVRTWFVMRERPVEVEP